MSSFARSGKTPRKKVERESINIDQFINKNELESIISDVYKYIEDNNSKLIKNVQQTKEQLKVQKTEIDNLVKKPAEVTRKPKAKIAPDRKSVV